MIRDGRTAWWRLGDGFVDDRLLEAADRKWSEHGGGSAIGRVLKVDALLERANPSWIGNIYLDDSGRDSPASLNSTGDM